MFASSNSVRGVTDISLGSLAGSETHESFLSSLVGELWNHVNPAVSALLKEMLEDIFLDMGTPLKYLKFQKFDLGNVPIMIENVRVHPEVDGLLQVGFDISWDSESDIQIRAPAGIKLGIDNLKISGRIALIFSPLMDEMPLIGTLQFAFINPPTMKLNFNGVASIADVRGIETRIRNLIRDILNDILVLPNRVIIKLCETCDFLDAYQAPIGIIRICVNRGRGFQVEKNLTGGDIPDVYTKIDFGVDHDWRTKTQWNKLSPVWDESRDFIFSHARQSIYLKAYDEDSGPFSRDDFLGEAEVTIADFLTTGASREIELIQFSNEDGVPVKTGTFVTLNIDIFTLCQSIDSFKSPEYEGPGLYCGLLTILVLEAFNLPLAPDDAAVYVKVTYQNQSYRTGVVENAPGVDPLNPEFNHVINVPLTIEMMRGAHSVSGNVNFTLMNSKDVLGSTSVTHKYLLGVPSQTVTEKRNIGNQGAFMRFSVILRGLSLSEDYTSIQSAGHKKVKEILVKKTLRVTAISGRGFETQKKVFTKDDVPDIYCTFSISTSKKKFRTRTIKNDNFPKWNQSDEFIIDGSPDEAILVKAWDENKKSKDDFLGSSEHTLKSLDLKNGDVEVEMRNKSGAGNERFITFKLEEVSDEAGKGKDRGAPPKLNAEEKSDVHISAGPKFSVVEVTLESGHGFQNIKKALRKVDIPDIYCIIRIPTCRNIWKTSTIKDNRNPSWGEKSEFPLTGKEHPIMIDVYDENRRTADEFLGSAKIAINTLIKAAGPREVEVLKMKRKTGMFLTLQAREKRIHKSGSQPRNIQDFR